MKFYHEDTKLKFITAGVSFLVALVCYLLTVAPTVSFWDCGEFVAAAHTLGIPHPPGTPFFNLIGRVVIVSLPFIDEIALRMNLISVFTSAITVFFCALITWDLVSAIVDDRKVSTPVRRRILTLATLTTGFLVTFSDTFWFSAVEAEVYGMSMLFVFLITWLTLVWARNKNTTYGNRLLILIVYLSYLGVGIHMYSLIMMPAIFVFVMWQRPDLRRLSNSWPVWLTGILLYSIVYAMSSFLSIALVLTIAAAILTVVIAGGPKPYFRLSLWFGIAAIVGYSTHAYIPIRSSLNPIIDENNPEIENVFDAKSWDAFNQFIERKQYGSESMLTRAFHRRGSLSNQFFTFPHIGFGGYQIAQYLPWKVGFVSFSKPGVWHVTAQDNAPLERGGISFPTQMSLFGGNAFIQFLFFLFFNGLLFWTCWEIYKKNRSLGFFIGFLFAIVSFGLVFYMNFGDGTRPDRMGYEYWVQQGKPAGGPPLDRHEVRERDYFYTPAYVLMGIIYGTGLGIWLLALYYKGKESLMNQIGLAAAALAFAIPSVSNFTEHNRSGLYVPWDYAYNLINSTEPNSIIFTNGDNDTFPLWFIQEVEGIRKDVRVVNLSLANTEWYIQQMLDNEPKVRLGMLSKNLTQLSRGIDIRSYEQVADKMLAELDKEIPEQQKILQDLANPALQDSLNVALGDRKDKMVQATEQKLLYMLNDWQVFTSFNKWKEKYRRPYMKTQDLVVLDIMRSNPERPIHFASTVGKENYVGMDHFMTLEGMVHTLKKFRQEQPAEFDADRTIALIDSVYQFRGINDGTFINDETMRLLYNYNSLFIRIALDAREQMARKQFVIAQLQADSTKINQVAAMKAQADQDKERGIKYLEFGRSKFPQEWRLYLLEADLHMVENDIQKAVAILEQGIENVPVYDADYLKQKLQEIKGKEKQGS